VAASTHFGKKICVVSLQKNKSPPSGNTLPHAGYILEVKALKA
jgi:hypothetical protein